MKGSILLYESAVGAGRTRGPVDDARCERLSRGEDLDE